MRYDVLCLSHLRWDFVYQRPQHLLSRCARGHRVFFVEEPSVSDGDARLEISPREGGVQVVVPRVPAGLDERETEAVMRALLAGLVREHALRDFVLWTYTPQSLPFALDLDPIAVVYDCMDQLSAFRGAPARLLEREAELFRIADVVFTGGESLYEEKRRFHPNAHAFPSSIDKEHFHRARNGLAEPDEQAHLPGPRLGFAGVIDERLDVDLVAAVAERRPQWQLVMLGPVVKIDPSELPAAPNLHYLGGRPYAELPRFMAGWDVALLPFARNEATRYISPTKTPEYLAAGRPVVSTSIPDVVRPYGQLGLVRIADDPGDFVAAVEAALVEDPRERQRAADAFLADLSWDDTWARMEYLVDEVVVERLRGMRSPVPRVDPRLSVSRERGAASRRSAEKHG
jgi:glycosyltransferase involved in cell wall biosynthesis